MRHLADLDRWTARYHHLADVARDRTWVATHGEPDSGNQLLTAEGRLLVDWESLKLAPPELDLRTLVDDGRSRPTPTPRCSSCSTSSGASTRSDEYAAWFAAPHTGTADDEIAFDGLLHELERT